MDKETIITKLTAILKTMDTISIVGVTNNARFGAIGEYIQDFIAKVEQSDLVDKKMEASDEESN